MCRAVECENCGLITWAGCGKHIEMALNGVPLEKRCGGWTTGVCAEGNEDTESMTDVIEQKLKAHFGNDIHYLEVQDVSGGSESKFSVLIALSNGFEGVKLLDRHRMINGKDGALATVMDKIHALEMKTWTKDQFETKQLNK